MNAPADPALDRRGGSGRLRSWIVGLALVCFAAGSLAGALFERRRAEPGPAGPFGGYQRLFTGHFDLSPDRQRLFAQVVRHYHREIEDVRQRALEDSMGTLEPELTRLGLRYRDLIRNHVLPESQRAEFDRLARASDWSADPDPEPGSPLRN